MRQLLHYATDAELDRFEDLVKNTGPLSAADRAELANWSVPAISWPMQMQMDMAMSGGFVGMGGMGGKGMMMGFNGARGI